MLSSVVDSTVCKKDPGMRFCVTLHVCACSLHSIGHRSKVNSGQHLAPLIRRNQLMLPIRHMCALLKCPLFNEGAFEAVFFCLIAPASSLKEELSEIKATLSESDTIS